MARVGLRDGRELAALDVGRYEERLDLIGFGASLVLGQAPSRDLSEAVHQSIGFVHQGISGWLAWGRATGSSGGCRWLR